MIKKLILLLLVVCGGVVTANATDYVIAGNPAIVNSNISSWENSNNDDTMIETSIKGVYYLCVKNCQLSASTSENPNEYTCAPMEKGTWTRPFNSDNKNDWTYGIKVYYSGSYDIHYYLNTNNNTFDVFATPMLRSNIMNDGKGNWSWTYDPTADFAQDNCFTWHFDIASSAIIDETNYFSIYTKANQREFYPSESKSVTWGTGDVGTFAYNRGSNSWSFSKPSFGYSKIRITLTYDPTDLTFTMQPDVYVSPTINNLYGTFSVAAPIDLSKATGLTAYYASNVSGSTVTMTKLEEAVAANTGLLLKKGEGEISIPVAASGTDLSNLNSLKYGTGATFASDGNTNRYVLATQGGVQNFYKLSTSGSTVPVGKAYLEIPATTGTAPSLSIDIDGETTGIEVINAEIPELGTANEQTFDLSGRRIAEPTKGVYIMNGKKMIVK